MDLNTASSLASIASFGATIYEWFTGTQDKPEERTVPQYLEWLRRKNHTEIIQQLEHSQASMLELTQLLAGLAAQSERGTNDILKKLQHDSRYLPEILRRLEEVLKLIRSRSTQTDFPQSDEHREFEEEYLSKVVQRFSHIRSIEIPELRALQQRLDIAYVSLSLSENASESAAIHADAAFRANRKMTIRGAPGGGKSTILSWVATQCANGSFLSDGLPSVPFFIPLRRLPSKERRAPNLSKFVEYTVPRSFWDYTVPKRWFNHVLESGRGVYLFDGIDEIPAADRSAFWEWFADFSQMAETNRFYITSRHFPEHGLEKELLWSPPADFVDASILEMDDGALSLFIEKWHAAIADACVNESDKKEVQDSYRALQKTLQRPGHRRVKELCKTPLLCTLVCTLHWKEAGYLPSRRIDLYERCCNLLIDARDAKKDLPDPTGILQALPFSDREMLLQRLALDMMRNVIRDQLVTGQEFEAPLSDVTEWIAEHIQVCSEETVQRSKPETILNLLIERTGMLNESTRGWVHYPHRTFQEYLAACAAGALHQAGDLISRVQDDQWHETIMLAAGTKTGGVGFGEQIVQGLLRRGSSAEAGSSERRICYALAVGCLETSVQLSVSLRRAILNTLPEIVPPKTDDESRILACAGNAVVPFLLYSQWCNEPLNVVCMCATTLARIGTEAAISELLGTENGRGFGSDRRVSVMEAVCECPGISPRDLQVLQRRRDRSQTVGAVAEIPKGIRKYFRSLAEFLEISQASHNIDLSSCTRIEELNALSRDVTSLTLASMPLLKNIDRLRDLTNLGTLVIRDCARIEDFGPLAECVRLQYLTIESVKRFDLYIVSRMRGLRELRLGNTGELESFAPLSGLTALEILDLRGCLIPPDVQVLERLPRLSDILVDPSEIGKFSDKLRRLVALSEFSFE